MSALDRACFVCVPLRRRTYPGRTRPAWAGSRGGLGPRGVEVIAIEHPRVDGRLVGVVGEDVPAAELELIEAGQRQAVLHGSGVEDVHLGEGAHREPLPPPREQDPGDGGGRHRAEPRDEHPELSVGGRDGAAHRHPDASFRRRATAEAFPTRAMATTATRSGP